MRVSAVVAPVVLAMSVFSASILAGCASEHQIPQGSGAPLAANGSDARDYQAGSDQATADATAGDASAAYDSYDTEMSFDNPVKDLPAGCLSCISLFRLSRPLMPLLNHIYIGAVINSTCGTETKKLLRIYGATKGAKDMEIFESYIASNKQGSDEMQFLGSACGTPASKALDAAVIVSTEWQNLLSDPIKKAARIAATPILGRPCAAAAREIVRDTKQYLSGRVEPRIEEVRTEESRTEAPLDSQDEIESDD